MPAIGPSTSSRTAFKSELSEMLCLTTMLTFCAELDKYPLISDRWNNKRYSVTCLSSSGTLKKKSFPLFISWLTRDRWSEIAITLSN